MMDKMQHSQPQQSQSEPVDYSAQLETRRRNFLSRLAGAVVAAVSGVLTGQKLLDKSLHKYIDGRLDTRDWTNGNLQHVFNMLKEGNAQTISGAPTSDESLHKWARDYLDGKTKAMPGTQVGNIHANAAYRDLIQHNPELIDKVTKNFAEKLKALTARHDSLLSSLEEKFFADPARCRAEINRINEAYKRNGNDKARIEALKELAERDKNRELFKGDVFKYMEEHDIIKANFYHYIHEAKKKLVDKPMFSEMIKSGTEPGRMGLGLRHAHDKEQIIAFSVVAATGMGVMANKLAKRFLARNDGKVDEAANDSQFQNAVIQRRAEQASSAAPSIRTA